MLGDRCLLPPPSSLLPPQSLHPTSFANATMMRFEAGIIAIVTVWSVGSGLLCNVVWPVHLDLATQLVSNHIPAFCLRAVGERAGESAAAYERAALL